MKTRSKRKLLWRVAFMTFFLSAILDNLTTSIVMIMVLRKLVQSRGDRLIYAALVIISANSGGAFSPIGDVTTIMLWIKGVITTQGVISEIFIPSLISMLLPAFILSLQLEGKFEKEQNLPKADVTQFTKVQLAGRRWSYLRTYLQDPHPSATVHGHPPGTGHPVDYHGNLPLQHR